MTRYFLIALSLLGIADSGYLLHVHVNIAGAGPTSGLCNLSDTLSCDAAAQSGYAEILGLPLPSYTLAFYTGVLLLLALGGLTRAVGTLLALLFGFSSIYSLFLAAVSVFQLSSLCPGCIVLYLVNLGSFVTLWLAGHAPMQIGPNLPLIRQPATHFLGGFAIAFMAASAWFSVQIAASEAERTEADQSGVRFPIEQVRAPQAPSLGPGDAPILLSVFSDFECPHCSRFSQTLHRIADSYPESVRVEFRHFPLTHHKAARFASLAGICAEQQGLFWPFHDLVFANQRELDPQRVLSFASSIGMDMKLLQSCLRAPDTVRTLESELDSGRTFGIQGTPAFLINGAFHAGGRNFDDLVKMIQDETRG